MAGLLKMVLTVLVCTALTATSTPTVAVIEITAVVSHHPLRLGLRGGCAEGEEEALSARQEAWEQEGGVSMRAVAAALGIQSTADDADAGAEQIQAAPRRQQHWLRAGAAPPRHSFPLSSKRMERLVEELELDLEDPEQAKMDALIREIDRDLPPDDHDSEAEQAAAGELARLKDRQALLGDYAPSLFNYALELHLRGDKHVPEAAKGSGGEVLKAEMASPDILAAADAYRRALTSCATSDGSSAGGRVCAAAACNNLGVLHYAHSELANYTAAQELWERALELQPECVDAMCNLAVLLQGLGQRTSTRETIHLDIARSEALLRRALALNATHVPAMNNLAYLLEKHVKQYDEAEQLYRQALDIEPHNVILLCNLAGFLCNVREPYDQETLMPVYFNKTCNAEGSFDPETGLAINPFVDRPVDRARALYHKALGYLPDKLVLAPFPADEDEDAPNVDVPRPLAHGQFMPAISPAVDESVEPNVVAARVAELQMSIGRLQRLL